MNWYRKYNKEKRERLKQADVVLKDKDYTAEETRLMYSAVTNHIFSQSKKQISNETNKYADFLEDFKNEM